MDSTLRWLHLSDLHLTFISKDKDYIANQEKMLRHLKKAIKDWIHTEKLDLIFITGDLALEGKSEEYKKVENFCEELLNITELPKKNLFLIPGNHDIDGEVPNFYKERLYTFENETEISDIVSDTNIYAILKRKLENFQNFYDNLFDIVGDYSKQRYIFAKTIKIAGKKINFLELNSTLFAGYKGDDEQKLAFSSDQVDQGIEALDGKADLTFIFFHHPFSCFHVCEKSIQNKIKQYADFILTGHLHDVNNIIQYDIIAKAIMIGARASTQNGYEGFLNLGTLNLENGQGHIQFYKYLDGIGWSKNTGINPYESEDGRIPFFIPSFQKTKDSTKYLNINFRMWQFE